ncbi:TMEM175 family protein [Glaciecola petra]|uniref:TMEM175 family protein n=1 Tax=Glaciecola petra TaxID=3075602 RepID=A0ABU2ZTY9_9ALTE|nr:TMEM175 family protein [Aestuariibacter sp. P117]MDT0596115.1 TMEM175 family protein [Aestuariibacter sp. P117]
MATHASASRTWTPKEVDSLIVEQGFRLRGLEVTRLDTFVDAAFAFVLTLLVISFDEIPSNYTEMLDAIKRIPAFAASFAVLMMFWRQHRNWSRRYGLENSQTILYSLLLIFIVLVYVYPLRMLFEGMFTNLSSGYLASSYQFNTYAEFRWMFIFYSAGFCAMSLMIALLYRAASKSADLLLLDNFERLKTKAEMYSWTIAIGFAAVSMTLAYFLPENLVTISGYMYFALLPLGKLPHYLLLKKKKP